MVSVLETPEVAAATVVKRQSPVAWVAIAVATTATLMWFGTGLTPIPWLTWLAPLPIFVLATKVSVRTATVAGFVAWAVGGGNMLSYYVGTLEVPAGVVIGFLVIQALAFCGTVALFGSLVQRGHLILAALAGAALWTGTEYLVSLFSPGGSFAVIGYTQAEVLPVIQVASVAGVWGVSFLLLAVPAFVAAGMVKPRVLIAGAALMVVALGYGIWQLQAPVSGTPMTVALVEVPQPEDSLPIASPQAQQVLERYLAQVPVAASAGATAMVLPEKVFKVTTAELDELNRRLTTAAAEHRITIVIGLTYRDTTGAHNIAIAYSGDGSTRYDKQNLVTGWEDHFTPGDKLAFLPGKQVGLIICKDLDHPQLSRQYAQQGATILLAPALDFDRDGLHHSRIAVVRGVENGMTVVRAAGDGQLTASDSHGRLLADVTTSKTAVTATTVTVQSGPSNTLYKRLGDWFAWACLALAAAALIKRFLFQRG